MSGTRQYVWPPAALVLWLAVPVAAHHSFAAEYDANRPIVLAGEIARIEFVNPHAWLSLDVKAPDGVVVRWHVEMGAPDNLVRRGVTRTTLQMGERVTVDGYLAKDGSHTVNGRVIRMPDGRTLFTGSVNTGDPLAR